MCAENIPTSMHKLIHKKKHSTTAAKKPKNSSALPPDATGVTSHPNPHYSQALLPLPFIYNLLLEDVGTVKTGDESSGAVFSACMAYRYILTRNLQPEFGAALFPVCFLMLNPSTADAEKLDPTIRRCVKFAERWGGDRLAIVNIFSYRATDPAAMKRQQDPVGARNREWVEHAVRTTLDQNGIVVAAWGGHGDHRGQDKEARKWLAEMGAKVHCLGLTEKTGQPRHPLFVPRLTSPVPFNL